MTPQSFKVEALRETYELLLLAAARRQPVAAVYDGLYRLLCPHVLGKKSGRLHVFVYQFGGASNRGLPATPEGAGVWRCLAVEKLSQVELWADGWHTEPRSSRQTCIDEVDFDTDNQSGEDPQ
jgi:hypothetical protein